MNDDLDEATKRRIEAEEAYRAQLRAQPAAAPQRAGWGQALLFIGILVVLGGCLTQLGRSSEPSSSPATPQPSTAAARSPAQNLAIIDGLSPDDPVMAAQFERLDAQCPENGSRVGDIVVNLQTLVKQDTGRELGLLSLVRQLATAQESANQRGMSCVDTAAALSLVLAGGK